MGQYNDNQKIVMDTLPMAHSRYKTIVDDFAHKIRSGALPPSSRLPTHRQLAKQYKMSLVTATRVYQELEAMGLVSGETGRGTFVREISLPPGLGIEQQVPAGIVDLNFNYPALPEQSEALRQALRQITTSGDLDSLLRYQPHMGRVHERAFIAQYVGAHGLNTTQQNVVVTSGAQHGLSCAAMALLKPGDVVAVDALTYPGFKILADLYHFEMVAIPNNHLGMDLAVLEKICQTRHVKAIYTMPTLHNPLAYIMDENSRQQLVALARQYDFWVIEDGAYAFLIENAPTPLAMLAPERTLYVSGFSKSVSSGLRVGFMVVPDSQLGAIERVIRGTTWNTPALMSHILCEWLQSGLVLQWETKKRQDAQKRQCMAQQVFAKHDYIAHPSSYFVWLPLPDEVRAEAVTKDLLQQGISVSSATAFATGQYVPHAIRLALGSVGMDVLPHALEKVRQVMDLHTDW